jgi:hypothetical protein
MNVFEKLVNAFPSRRLGETYSTADSLAEQLAYMICTALWHEYGLSLIEREIYLQEEIASLEKQRAIDKITPGKEQNLKVWQKELRNMDLIWWFWERKYYTLPRIIPGSWICHFHKNFGSALASNHAELYCQMRGGCCSRNCGCCSKERRTSRPKGRLQKHIGHCTHNCGCCTRYNQHLGMTDLKTNPARKLLSDYFLTHNPVYPFYHELRVIEEKTGENVTTRILNYAKDSQPRQAKLPQLNSFNHFLYQNYPECNWGLKKPSPPTVFGRLRYYQFDFTPCRVSKKNPILVSYRVLCWMAEKSC